MKALLIAIALIVLQTLAASAQELSPPEGAGAPQGEMKHEGRDGLDPNCKAELKQLCPGAEPGGGRIKKCIEANEGKLSAGCRQKLQEKRAHMKQRMQEMRAACEADVKRLCPNVEPGGGRVRDCLKSHQNELSPTCAQKMEHRKKP
jgi:cysteine rich repeat protein